MQIIKSTHRITGKKSSYTTKDFLTNVQMKDVPKNIQHRSSLFQTKNYCIIADANQDVHMLDKFHDFKYFTRVATNKSF